MHSENGAELKHYNRGDSVSVSRDCFYEDKIQLVVDFIYRVKCYSFARHCLIQEAS